MSRETRALSRLYFNKLESALIYNFAARSVKGYSEFLFSRLYEFSGQDINHATNLHGFLLDMCVNGHQVEDVGVEPMLILGVGEKNTEKEQDAFLTMTKTFLVSLEKLEERCEKQVKTCLSYEVLETTSSRHLNLPGLLSIAKERREIFRDLLSRVRDLALFQRTREIFWKCAYCGLILSEETAPETCPCCGSPQSYMGAGTWNLP